MTGIADELDRTAAGCQFSGVVHIGVGEDVPFVKAFGLADRGSGHANTVDTRFGVASGTKGLTAMTVMSVVESGELSLATSARSVLGEDLPLIGDDVTVEQLLGHRSGIGDYFDEDDDTDVNDVFLPVPVAELDSTEAYLRVLDGFPTTFAPDERFSYCNGGYVVLALIAERTTGTPFHDLVSQRVCKPAGLADTAFLRSDELPDGAAVGYLDAEGARTNALNLPVRGSGDGGIYTTAADVHALWRAFFAGRIVSPDSVREMVRPRSDVPAEAMRYGLGFWLDETTDGALLVGGDAGVSFWSIHDPGSETTYSVLGNTTASAWPIARVLRSLRATGVA